MTERSVSLNSESPSSTPALTAGWICSSCVQAPLALRKNRKNPGGRGEGSVHRLDLF